ncbi:MAG: bifunctional phosphopantothenoylcysteine decarboxylase/phosphopantothenate--cysteine ligase CoaBC [Armatimonadota bacterium]
MSFRSLEGKRVVLGVTGSIAAYKAAELASSLAALKADVHVAMTPSAVHFVGPATFRALTGHTPLTGAFDEIEERTVAHVALVENADLLVIAPATGNIIGKIANGIADEIVSTLAMAAPCPVLLAPAMNTHMWTNPIVIANVDRLRNMGYHFVDPVEGRLACGYEGVGKMAPVERILEAVERLLLGAARHDWEDVPVLITAGPTREPIDPVRYLSNYSTGSMGFAIAAAAQERGAEVTLVTGPTEMQPPDVTRLVRVQTASEMLEAVRNHFGSCRVLISAAAVSDFSPVKSPRKLKKLDQEGERRTLELHQTPDILAEMGRQKQNQILVGFALETEDLITNARQKLEGKNLDMIVANSAGEGEQPFGPGPSKVRFLTRGGEDHPLPMMSKQEIAEHLLTFIRERFLQRG